jgi:hypothetical protein
LPERSRLQRLLRDHAEDALDFLADPSLFSVLDTYGIELLHPRREGCSPQEIGKKGKSNGRWIDGIKLAWLINNHGEVIDWTWPTANEPDTIFRPLATEYDGEMIALADLGLREKDAPPSNIKCCEAEPGMSASPSRPI